MPRHRKDSIRKSENVRYEKGSAIAGDQILYECRMPPSKTNKIRASANHYIFQGRLEKNAYAIINKTYTNQQR